MLERHSFQEVMRQWVRARKATASNADGENVLSIYPLEAYDDSLIASIEKNVMQWATEHPEPVYPRWGDWLAEMGIICWENNGDGVYSVMAPTMKICTPIPADIAQKLGVQPKEAKHSANE